MSDTVTREELAKLAVKAMDMSYSPYSGYKVGAALLCSDGTVYRGANIENASYSVSNCAERTAFFKAVNDGRRDFTAIAVCGGKGGILSDEIFSPCGVCRQVMREFCDDSFLIHMVTASDITTVTLAELLPYGFKPDRLERQ